MISARLAYAVFCGVLLNATLAFAVMLLSYLIAYATGLAGDNSNAVLWYVISCAVVSPAVVMIGVMTNGFWVTSEKGEG